MIPFHISHCILAAASFALVIPANVTDLRAKLKSAFDKKPVDKTDPAKPDPNHDRRIGTEVAKERARRKALAEELANEKTSSDRLKEIAAGAQAKAEALEAELEERNAELEKVKPQAKRWSDFENKERTKLLAKFPPEEQKDAKKLADAMDLEAFRIYTTRITGGTTTEGQKTVGKDGAKNWEAILSGDPAQAEKAIAEDKDGFNKFMDAQGK